MQKRFDQIDALKGFAMFLVVLGHAIIVYPINIHNDVFFGNLYNFVCTFHLPLFFIVSGYCFSYKGNYKEFIIGKCKRILVPYFVFGLINTLLRLLFPSLANGTDTIINLLINLFINGGEYWFLFTLFIIFLIYPLLNKLINSNKYISIFSLFVLLIISILNINVKYLCITPLLKYMVYFHCGALIKKYLRIDFVNKNIAYSIVTFIVLIIIFVLYQKTNSNILETLCAVLGIIFSYYLCCLNPITNLFKEFGKYSLQIHLLNGYSLVFSRTIICMLTSNYLIIVVFNLLFDYLIVYYFIKLIVLNIKPLKIVMGIN